MAQFHFKWKALKQALYSEWEVCRNSLWLPASRKSMERLWKAASQLAFRERQGCNTCPWISSTTVLEKSFRERGDWEACLLVGVICCPSLPTSCCRLAWAAPVEPFRAFSIGPSSLLGTSGGTELREVACWTAGLLWGGTRAISLFKNAGEAGSCAARPHHQGCRP